MFGSAVGSAGDSLADIERRMHQLERRIEQLGGSAAGIARGRIDEATQLADRVAETVTAALAGVIERLRSGARDLSAAGIGGTGRQLGHEVAQASGAAVRRVSHEIERHPLAALAVAVGVGILIGMGSRR